MGGLWTAATILWLTLSIPTPKSVLDVRMAATISAIVTCVYLLSLSFFGVSSQLAGIRGGVATFAGKNVSQRISHFLRNELIPVMSGSHALLLGLSKAFMALWMLLQLPSLNVSSECLHCAFRIALPHLFADFLYLAPAYWGL